MRTSQCDSLQEKKCRKEFGEELMDWTCSQCEKKKADQLSPYMGKMFRLHHLKLAGYPFKADDLSPEEWEDLGKVEEFKRWQHSR